MTVPAARTRVINEIANAVTHGVGFFLAVAALVILAVYASRHGDAWHVVSFSIYGATLVLLYLLSTLYHSIGRPRVKRVLRILDHCAIYLLIAGTYTPFALVTLRQGPGWVIFGVIWGLALAGIIYKVFFIDRFVILSTLCYPLMGLLIVAFAPELLRLLPPGGFILLAAGGASYIVGMIFYAGREKMLMHAIWHLFVLGGSACHFFAVILHVLPARG